MRLSFDDADEVAVAPVSGAERPDALWSWRREVADLYAAIRAAAPRDGWRLWRATRDRLFREHSQTPLDAPERFAGLACWPYDPRLRFAVELLPHAAPEPRRIFVGGDGWLDATPMARTRGLEDALGAELTVFWIGGYGGGAWLPFQDATSGRDSYGGGRYLLDTIKGADLGADGEGRTVLDFNFAYNPSCAYSPRWTCPLAPPGSRLPAAVRAGERSFAG
jgi:uncharacterized protein (DUF1684 family)